MSYTIVSKTLVDALITVARRWAGSTLAFELPGPVADALDLTDEEADRLGLVLLKTNWNTAVLGNDPDLDPQEIAWMEQEWTELGFVKPVTYSFDELPGLPAPESALSLIRCYRYQSDWEGEGLGKAGPFIDALEAAARHQLGSRAEDVRTSRAFRDIPWLPTDADRDMFLRAGA